MNGGNKPVPVMLETPVETDLSEDMTQRDADFYAFVQNTPVSYTHLDVYKRQRFRRSSLRFVRIFHW